jgi:general secretion pathway protein J
MSTLPRWMPPGRRGFTLVEVMVAVALFALAAALALGGMNAITRARGQLQAEAERLAALQLAVGMAERDLRGVALREVREGYGQLLPPLLGARAGLELSRHASTGLLREGRADLERVAYRVQDGRWLRLRYPVLDRVPASEPLVDQLLEGVESVDWRYLGRAGAAPLDAWPPPRGGEALPRAVELRLTLRDFGEIRRVFELPGGAPR